MARSDYDVIETYTGLGTSAVYTFDFKVEELAQLLILEKDTLGVETQKVRGTDVTYLSGVVFDSVNGGGTVTLAANLPLNYTLYIILANDAPTQPSEYRNKGNFTLRSIENALDWLGGAIQRLAYLAGRSIKLPESMLSASFDPTLPVEITNTESHLIVTNPTGTGFIIGPTTTAVSTPGAGALELPTDGAFGGPLGDPTNLQVGDSYPDAFDKVVTLLSKISPIPPVDLSAHVLLLTLSYDALEATSGDAHATVTDDTTPEISPGTVVNYANSFADADSGILSANVDAVEVGSITLSTADDTGTDGDLEIIDDFDPYAGVPGSENIFTALVARITSSVLAVGSHTAQLLHTLTGSSTQLTFYVDDPATVTVDTTVLTAPGTSSYLSGVPGVAQGQNLNVTFNVNDAVKTHYNSTRIARANGSQVVAANAALPGTPPIPDAIVAANINVAVAASAYSENVSVTCTGYNSKAVTGTAAATASVRVDTMGVESARLVSSTGQYPATGYGGAYTSTDLLSANKELQYLNGSFQDPPAVDYTAKLPAGPDYSALTGDAYGTFRWATFSLGAISAASSISFTIAGAVGFGASAIVTGIDMYIKVEGVTGWLDANAAYPGVGTPASDGDPALNVGSSTATSKVVTFGATPRTGTVYVRIGLPASSTKTFTGIS